MDVRVLHYYMLILAVIEAECSRKDENQNLFGG